MKLAQFESSPNLKFAPTHNNEDSLPKVFTQRN